MMEVSKVLLYCTKAKPLLINFPFLNGDKIQRFWTVKNNDGKDKYQHVLNGFVCFECECNEVFDMAKKFLRERKEEKI